MLYTAQKIATTIGSSVNFIRVKLRGIEPAEIGARGLKKYKFEVLPEDIQKAIMRHQEHDNLTSGQTETEQPNPDLETIEKTDRLSVADLEAALESIKGQSSDTSERDQYFQLEKLRLVTPKLINALLRIFTEGDLCGILVHTYGLKIEGDRE